MSLWSNLSCRQGSLGFAAGSPSSWSLTFPPPEDVLPWNQSARRLVAVSNSYCWIGSGIATQGPGSMSQGTVTNIQDCIPAGYQVGICSFVSSSETQKSVLSGGKFNIYLLWKIASSHMINIYCNWWFRHHHVRLPEAGGWEGKIRSYGCIMYPVVSIFPKKRVAKELREERGF